MCTALRATFTVTEGEGLDKKNDYESGRWHAPKPYAEKSTSDYTNATKIS
jgi:hypothetical protein